MIPKGINYRRNTIICNWWLYCVWSFSQFLLCSCSCSCCMLGSCYFQFTSVIIVYTCMISKMWNNVSPITLTCTDNPIKVWCCTLFTRMRTFIPLTCFWTIRVTLACDAEHCDQQSSWNEQSVKYINVSGCTLFTHIYTLFHSCTIFTHTHWMSYLTLPPNPRN